MKKTILLLLLSIAFLSNAQPTYIKFNQLQHAASSTSCVVTGTDGALTYTPTFPVSKWTNDALYASRLSPTPVKTANYSVVAGDFVPCDVSGGSFTLTLPTAPIDGSMAEAKIINSNSVNVIVVKTGGSDVFNKTGGASSGTITLSGQAMVFQYKSSTAIWYVIGEDLPLNQLDARYTSTLVVGWSVLGNSVAADSSNFIGTTNSKPLIFKANNSIVGRFDASGYFGFGALAPAFDVELKRSTPLGPVSINAANTSSTGYCTINISGDNANNYAGLFVVNKAGGIGSFYDNNTAYCVFGSTTTCGLINEQAGGSMIFANGTFGPSGEAIRIASTRNIGLSGSNTTKITVPLAIVELGAGGTTYGPLRLNTGPLVTTTANIVPGLIEFLTNTFYISTGTTSATRYKIGAVLTGSATLDFPATASLSSQELTIAVANTAVGDPVQIGTPSTVDANASYFGYISATGTVTVRFVNSSTLSINPASGTFKVAVNKN